MVCCRVCERGCGWGPPTPHSNPHPTSTRTVYIHITHYPHTHPKLRVSAGLVDPRGSMSMSNGRPSNKSTSSTVHVQTRAMGWWLWWVHNVDGSTIRKIHRKMSTNPSLHLLQQRAHPGGQKRVLQGVARCRDGRPSWDGVGWWVSGVKEGDID